MQKLTYNRIKETLANKGKTNIDLATFMEVDPRVVSSWCTNKNQPEYATLFKISDYLGVEAGELLTLKKDLRPIEKKKGKIKPAHKSKGKRQNS